MLTWSAMHPSPFIQQTASLPNSGKVILVKGYNNQKVSPCGQLEILTFKYQGKSTVIFFNIFQINLRLLQNVRIFNKSICQKLSSNSKTNAKKHIGCRGTKATVYTGIFVVCVLCKGTAKKRSSKFNYFRYLFIHVLSFLCDQKGGRHIELL